MLATLVIVGFLAVLTWYYGYSVPLAVGIILGTAVLAEFVFFHPHLTKNAVATAIQLIVVSSFSLIIYSNIANSYDAFLAISVQLVSMITIITTLIGNYYFSRGKFLWNNIFAFVIYDGIILAGSMLGSINYILTALIALGGTVAYIAIRRFVLYRRIDKFKLESLPSTVIDKKIKDSLLETKTDLIDINIEGFNNRLVTLHNDKAIFVLLPLNPKRYFTIIKNDAWLDREVVTGAFEAILEETRIASKQLKIHQKAFVPIVYTSDKNQLGKTLVSLNIKSKVKPDKSIGKVYIATNKGLNKLIDEYSSRDNLSSKTLDKLK